MPRELKCTCGVCKRCKHRVYMRGYLERRRARGVILSPRALGEPETRSVRVQLSAEMRVWLREQIDIERRKRCTRVL